MKTDSGELTAAEDAYDQELIAMSTDTPSAGFDDQQEVIIRIRKARRLMEPLIGMRTSEAKRILNMALVLLEGDAVVDFSTIHPPIPQGEPA